MLEDRGVEGKGPYPILKNTRGPPICVREQQGGQAERIVGFVLARGAPPMANQYMTYII